MATVRAIMTDVEQVGATSNQVTWTIDWLVASQNTAESYPARTQTVTLIGDTAAVIQGKIIDSLVAWATGQGHTLARTDVYLIQYSRGS